VTTDSLRNEKAITNPDPDGLRDALRFWTTGVTIVAAAHDGNRHGMTVNSFTSLSLNPPLVSVSLEKVTRTHQLVESAGKFAVSILAEDQRSVSDRFAGRETDAGDRFTDLDTWSLVGGSPILRDALAYFDCEVTASHDAGTHTLFIGKVLACGQQGDRNKDPLVYYNRGYRDINSV
jgi:flavin reductase (DIM6/NTAB) family NADH-FMN oxidoreductase RutF